MEVKHHPISQEASKKFQNRYITSKGEQRGYVEFDGLKTLWFNTGTLCNLSCDNCYIESSPKNDQLSYLTLDDVTPFLKEISDYQIPVESIGFTGGEPFLNPSIIQILRACLSANHQVLVLTNAFRVIKRWQKQLAQLKDEFGHQLRLRVSLDHFTPELHEKERGTGTFTPTLQTIQSLYQQGFHLSIAGRSMTNEPYDTAITGYQKLLHEMGVQLDLKNDRLVIFPEMISGEDVPEITTECWGILNKSPSSVMCSNQRMIVKNKGKEKPQIQACTLLAYSEKFNMGDRLKEAENRVYLNHEFCAKFCVLGGASCTSTN